MMEMLPPHVIQFLSFAASAFIFMFGVLLFVLVIVFIYDVSQKKNAVLRNYPVIGHLRGVFVHLGEFFRQYFFAMDREEMPFNRAERDWITKSAQGRDNTVAFGSTKILSPVGTVLFANCAFPKLSEETQEPPVITIGPYVREPYKAGSILNISAMSYGALSTPAVKALSKGAELANCWLNTGEGGLAPYHLEGDCDIVYQIGTAKYGVRNEQGNLCDQKLREIAGIPQVKMFEIKLSQGAKPGKGGILPAAKVTKEISRIRGIPAHEASISPNRHVEIDSVPNLLNMIAHIRNITGLPVGFKTVVGDYGWLQNLCEEINSRGIESAPDFITIDSGDGGTGAAPMPLMDNVGLPVKESLLVVLDILIASGLRERIKVITSGKLVTPAEVAWAYCAGADFVVSARGFMFALGCIQALKCNKNTCPTGITTHDRRLQRGLDPTLKAVRIKNYVEKIRYGTGIIAHSCGVAHPRDLKRHHCRIVQVDGKSILLNELYPVREFLVKTKSQNAA